MSYTFNPNVKNIVIAHPSRKAFYLRKKAKDPYLDLVVMTLPEMKALFNYNYDDRALRYLLAKDYRYLVAKDLLEAFCAPDFEKGVEVKKYADLRDELIKEHLLFKVAYPEKTFIGSHILISGYYREASIISQYLGSLSGKMEIDYETEAYREPSENVVNKFIDPYEELHFVYNKIAYDIDVNKTPISDMYVYGLSSDYLPLINEFNKMYGISIGLIAKERLFDKGVYKVFRENYLERGLEESLLLMREKYPDSKDADTIESFAREFAIVFEKDPAKTLSIYDDIAKEKTPYVGKYKNLIEVLDEPVCPPDGHLYCVNFAMGTYPSVKNESGLFSDKEKERIGLMTSKDYSFNDSERVDRLLHNGCLKLLSFFELGFENHHFLSGFVEKYKIPVVSNPTAEDKDGPYEYAHDKGGFLFAALEDEYVNYLTEDKRRGAYKNVSGLEDYRNYKYAFKGTKILRNKNRRYSASSLTNYRSCPFKYLLNNILYLDDSPSDFSARIGNVFHKTLEMSHTEPSFDFDKAYDLSVAYEQGLITDPKASPHEKKTPFSPKEKAIIENLRKYCKKSLDFQKSYEANLKNPSFMAEDSFNISFGGITVNGRYDKVITFDFNDERYAFIIDYKTGGAKFDEALFRSDHGLSLQLPLYAFALESDKAKFGNAKIAGLFISPILAYDLTKSEKENNKTLAQIDQNKSRLMGLYLNSTSFISSFEPQLTKGSSSLIDGCMIKKDGSFDVRTEYPKNKSESDFHDLAERAKGVILDSDKAIMEGHFEIDPTVVKGKHNACDYCSFHDVCFIDKKKIVGEILSKINMNPDLDDGDDVKGEEEEE